MRKNVRTRVSCGDCCEATLRDQIIIYRLGRKIAVRISIALDIGLIGIWIALDIVRGSLDTEQIVKANIIVLCFWYDSNCSKILVAIGMIKLFKELAFEWVHNVKAEVTELQIMPPIPRVCGIKNIVILHHEVHFSILVKQEIKAWKYEISLNKGRLISDQQILVEH